MRQACNQATMAISIFRKCTAFLFIVSALLVSYTAFMLRGPFSMVQLRNSANDDRTNDKTISRYSFVNGVQANGRAVSMAEPDTIMDGASMFAWLTTEAVEIAKEEVKMAVSRSHPFMPVEAIDEPSTSGSQITGGLENRTTYKVGQRYDTSSVTDIRQHITNLKVAAEIYYNKEKDHVDLNKSTSAPTDLKFKAKTINVHIYPIPHHAQLPSLLHDVLGNTTRMTSGHGSLMKLNQSEENGIDNHKDDVKLRPTQVIILTTKRSGSSFVGELFNVNPYVFYTFEPLYTLTGDVINHKIQNSKFNQIATDVWDHILRCNFSTTYPPASSWIYRGTTGFDSCSSVKAIRSNKLLCPVKQVPNLKVGSVVSYTCQARPYTVIKTIRVQSISDLRSFMEDPALNVRILHLVRDPRAVMRSRWNLMLSGERNADLFRRKGPAADEIQDLCLHMARNMELGLSLPKWLDGRYIRVRFEDVALDPINETRKMYRQLGMTLHQDVITHIQRNAHLSAQKRRTPFSPFSTTRDAQKVVDAWKGSIKGGTLRRIESTCRDVMKQLSYKTAL